MKYRLGERRIETRGDHWIAPDAAVMGSVVLEENASIWWQCVVRGDSDVITIGENSNIQDASVLHTDPGILLTIGKNVSVGHLVMLHGCIVGDDTLIGMQAVVLNGAKIGRNCIVGAGALIASGKEFPEGSLIIGNPARVVRQLTPQQIADLRVGSEHYIANARRFRSGCERIG